MEQLIEREEEERMTAMDEDYDYQRDRAMEAESMYLSSKNVMDTYKKQMDEAKEVIVELAAKGMEFDLIKITHVERKGKVDMKVLQRKFDLMDGDVDACRKEKIISTRITVKK